MPSIPSHPEPRLEGQAKASRQRRRERWHPRVVESLEVVLHEVQQGRVPNADRVRMTPKEAYRVIRLKVRGGSEEERGWLNQAAEYVWKNKRDVFYVRRRIRLSPPWWLVWVWFWPRWVIEVRLLYYAEVDLESGGLPRAYIFGLQIGGAGGGSSPT